MRWAIRAWMTGRALFGQRVDRLEVLLDRGVEAVRHGAILPTGLPSEVGRPYAGSYTP